MKAIHIIDAIFVAAAVGCIACVVLLRAVFP